MGKVGGKRPLSKPSRKWDDIIEIDHEEVGCSLMDCIVLGQARDMGCLGGKSPLSRPRRESFGFTEFDSQEFGCGVCSASGWVRIGKLGNLEERDL